MLTRVPAWYTPWKRWLAPPIYNPNLLRADLERIAALLRASGHYQSTVSHDRRVDGTRLTIVVTIDEGPIVRVKSIDLEIVDFEPSAAEEAELRAEIALASGAVFTQAGYDAGRDRLELLLRRRGFAYVAVEKGAVVDTTSNEVAVRYRVTRGIPAIFGTTFVDGTDRVAVCLVRREIAFRPGDPYRVSIGKYVADDIFVSLAHRFGAQSVEEIRIEYVIRPEWSLETSTDTLGRSGVDLFWKRRY